jgi:putative spermidine/putrescine transport system substrate-binding protein
MFADGELVMNMSYGPFSVATGIAQGTYTETTQTFVFDKGTIGNTNYMAIGFNSPNKAGSLVIINAIISGEIQLTQYAELRELPVVASEKLSADEKAAFDAVDLGKGVLSQAELLAHRLPEMPASLVPIIEEIWLSEVVGK